MGIRSPRGRMVPPLFRLYQAIWVALDWLYPPQCAGCQESGFRWCEECRNNTPKVSIKHCIFCESRLPKSGVCACTEERNQYLDKVFAWGLHTGPLRQALHRLKYRRDLGLGEVLARHLILIAEENTLPQDVIIPIPLGKRRRNERGYNQAALLARPLALALNISYRPGALKRIRETKSQVGLSFAQRRENVSGAFEAVPKLVSGRRVLLVDDVMTTSATLEAAAQALKNAGAADVQGLTLAKTVKFV